MKKHLLLLLIAPVLQILFVNKDSNALIVRPKPFGPNRMFLRVNYNPNSVYHIVAYYGRTTYFQLEPGETGNTLLVSKPFAWDWVVKDGRVYFQPIQSDADTTVTLTTNKRTYFFYMTAEEPTGPFDPNVPFFIEFKYPEDRGASKPGGQSSLDDDIQVFEYTADSLPGISNPENYNFDYRVSGDDDILPLAVFDDGSRTFIKTGNEFAAPFAIDKRGFEVIVNFRAAGDYLIIDGVMPKLVLRSGSSTVCIWNGLLEPDSDKTVKKK